MSVLRSEIGREMESTVEFYLHVAFTKASLQLLQLQNTGTGCLLLQGHTVLCLGALVCRLGNISDLWDLRLGSNGCVLFLVFCCGSWWNCSPLETGFLKPA